MEEESLLWASDFRGATQPFFLRKRMKQMKFLSTTNQFNLNIRRITILRSYFMQELLAKETLIHRINWIQEIHP